MTIKLFDNTIALLNQCPRIAASSIFVLMCQLYGVGMFSPIIVQAHDSVSVQDTLSTVELKKLSLEDLMDIEVTSVSKHPEKLLETASAIQVITGEDIRRSGASSIPEALRLAGNLDVVQKNSYDWGVSARGFNASVGDKLLVLIDGRTVYTPLFSGVIWSLQDYLLEDIDRIEVISGPGGTLWGANAVNGVINIITKSAKESQGTYLSAGGGTELQDFAGVRYGGTLASDVYFRIYGKYFNINNAVIGNGSNASDAAKQGRGGFRIDAAAFPQDHLTLQGDYYDGNENLQTGGTAKVKGGNLLSRWLHTFSDESDMSLQLYYDWTHLTDPFPAAVNAPFGYLKDDLDTYDLDFQHHFHLDKWNNIVWGIGYRFTHEVDVNAPTVAFLPPVLDQDLFSGFVQDEIMLHENLFLTLGSKLEHNDYTRFEFEPNARLQWNFIAGQMLWAAVSRAVRTPARYDRDLFEPNPVYGVFLGGNSDFVSETLNAYELGYRAQLNSRVSTSVSTFYNRYNNLRSAGYTPVTFLPLIFQNNDEGETYGIEISANFLALDWWRLHGGYDLLKEHIRVKPGKVDLFNALNETADPEHQFSLRSSMDLPQNVELDAALRWVDLLLTNNGATPGTVPSYLELDIRLGWHPMQRLELSIVGQNLLHDHHPEYGFPGPTREEIQRSVYGKVSWQF